MTSELVIVFLYDCDLCKSEEDDPQDAIVYFYPTWVSSEQRHALCSQLMGVTQFFNSSFSSPSVIALQSGKFAVRKTGHFALVVGTDRSIPDSLLRRRLASLCDILRLFHYSIESIESMLNEEDENLSDKISQLLQTYLPIVLDGAYPFENIPLYKLPKSRSSILDEARCFLGSLQKRNSILGGAILYQNKVIHSQLSCNLSKLIILAHPYKVKIPDSSMATAFNLPTGVQLLRIFVDIEESTTLRLQGGDLVQNAASDASVQINSSLAEKILTGKCTNGTSSNTESDVEEYSSRKLPSDVEESSDGLDAEKSGVPDLVLDAVRARQLIRMSNLSKQANASRELQYPAPIPTSKTAEDICAINNIPLRYFSIGLPKIKASWTDRKSNDEQCSKKLWYNTICDPKYPLFKPNGLPASYSLFSQPDGSRSPFKIKENGKSKKSHRDLSNERPPKKESRQLSLSLNKYSERPPPKDAPLTPLMAKMALSVAISDNLDEPEIAANNQSNAKRCSSSEPSSLLLGLNISKKTESESRFSDASQHAMFVYGCNSTSIILILEESAATNSTLINSLWEKSDEYLKAADDELDKAVDEAASSWCSGAELSSAGEYSYAIVDKNWGPVERRGFYRPHQIQMVTSLHETFTSHPHIIDVLVREEDSVTYGYRSDPRQIFYQQHCAQNWGVPTPADLMGVIPWKAKSILQRDHHVTAV